MTQRHGKTWRLLLAGLLLVLVASVGVKFGLYHVMPRRFVEVVPGHVYRSGFLEQWPLQRVIEEHRIRTILTLLNYEPDNPDQERESRTAEAKNVRMLRIGMPGDGLADFDRLDKAANVLADASTHPVLVHCAAGVNRTGAVCAAWRMKHCGWNPDRALQEAEECGWSPRDNPELREHLLAYYRSRVASQPAHAAAE